MITDKQAQQLIQDIEKTITPIIKKIFLQANKRMKSSTLDQDINSFLTQFKRTMINISHLVSLSAWLQSTSEDNEKPDDRLKIRIHILIDAIADLIVRKKLPEKQFNTVISDIYPSPLKMRNSDKQFCARQVFLK
jgi:hypothetical protein